MSREDLHFLLKSILYLTHVQQYETLLEPFLTGQKYIPRTIMLPIQTRKLCFDKFDNNRINIKPSKGKGSNFRTFTKLLYMPSRSFMTSPIHYFRSSDSTFELFRYSSEKGKGLNWAKCCYYSLKQKPHHHITGYTVWQSGNPSRNTFCVILIYPTARVVNQSEIPCQTMYMIIQQAR